MTLTIIIPTFNSENVISRALDSIVNQSFTDFEVLIMDGVSWDKTLNSVSRYQDSRIRIYSEPDKGIYDAMNKGIKKASGDWLYFLGSDDYLLHDDVLNQVFSQDLNDYEVFYGDVETQCLSIHNHGEWTMPFLTYNRCHQCIFYRKELFEKIGLYNLKYKVFADFDFNLKWFLNRNVKSKYAPIVIAYFSDGGYSSKNIDDPLWDDFDRNILKYGFFKLPMKKRLGCIKRIITKHLLFRMV